MPASGLIRGCGGGFSWWPLVVDLSLSNAAAVGPEKL